MPRRSRRLAGILVASAALLPVPTAVAHSGNPDMQSVVDAVRPKVPGISLQVLNRDDRFELINRSDQPVVIGGYEGEPYARVLPDGSVEVNQRSSATYLNEDRYGGARVPAGVDPKAAPRWKLLDRTGRYQWHDHRMHYMASGVPPQVKDKAKRTKVFDYRIPLQIGARKGAIAGTLYWAPQTQTGPPVAAIVAFVALLAAGGGAVVLTRRRRGATAGAGAREEAW